MELFKLGFFVVRLTDVADIGVVAFLLYKMYKLFQRTIVLQVLVAFMLVFVVWKVADALNMLLLKSLLDQLIQVGAIALVVVFSPEVRRFLVTFTQRASILNLGLQLRQATNLAETQIQELIEACQSLANQHTGAIILIEGESDLRHIEQTGDMINADLSKRLLLSIFNKMSPLHDGAVVVRGTQIVAARCVLPISDDPDVPAELGLRHRAALGMTEVSDALAIVISEESGKIAVARAGRIKRNLSADELYTYIDTQRGPTKPVV